MLDQSNRRSAIIEILNAEGASRVLLVCDHASNFIPPELCNLGLESDLLTEHIAWDIGIADLTRALAHRWNATTVLCGFSRLILDPNRAEDSMSLIPSISEHHVIPGNETLTEVEKVERIKRYHRPYHAALQQVLNYWLEHKEPGAPSPIVICTHSFTPVFNGEKRPWHLSVMWDRDSCLASPLISRLRDAGYVVGDNEPYSAQEETGHTMRSLCDPHDLPGIMIEIRQDLIGNETDIQMFANIVGSAVEAALVDLDTTN